MPLSRRLVLDADEERRTLERELHDGVFQQLVALAVNLQRAREDPAQLEEAAADVQRALEETARLAQRIYPTLLDVGDLAAALRAAAAAAGVDASVAVAAAGHYPPEILASVHFCWLAALDRPACEGRTTISVRDEGEAVALEIGTGRGAGLDRLRDRVEALGGRLAIRPEGGGVHVSVWLPAAGCR